MSLTQPVSSVTRQTNIRNFLTQKNGIPSSNPAEIVEDLRLDRDTETTLEVPCKENPTVMEKMRSYNKVTQAGIPEWNPFSIKNRKPSETDEVNNEKGWFVLPLFISKLGENKKIAPSDMTFDNAVLLWTKVLGLSPIDLDSVSLRLPHRPLFTSTRRIMKDEIFSKTALPCNIELKDREGETFTANVESRALMKNMNEPLSFEIRVPEVRGTVATDVIQHCVGLFAKVESIGRVKKRADEILEASNAKIVKDWSEEIRTRVSTSTPHASVTVFGKLENIPSYLPIDQQIRPLYFPGRKKQCAKCYNFGHLMKDCVNRPKSPSEYRRWLARRMKRIYPDNTPVPITINLEDLKKNEKPNVLEAVINPAGKEDEEDHVSPIEGELNVEYNEIDSQQKIEKSKGSFPENQKVGEVEKERPQNENEMAESKKKKIKD
nr:uncharacterized protein LOC121116718 [Lepeophtheirus salmonis]